LNIGFAGNYARSRRVGATSKKLATELDLLERLVANVYRRDDVELSRCTFRVRGDTVDNFHHLHENSDS